MQPANGEQCDDGNTADMDGCSRNCKNEAVQGKTERKCIGALNKAGAGVFRALGKESLICIVSFAKGKSTDAQACVTADAKGRMAKAKAVTEKLSNAFCSTAPSFGYTNAAAINSAAGQNGLGLFADIFGADLNTAMMTAAANPVAAACQIVVAKRWEILATLQFKEFLACKKSGLKAGTVVSAATLENCFDAIDTDGKGKIAKSLRKLGSILAKKCGALDLSTAFPAGCAGRLPLENCIGERVRCRVCLSINAVDGLSKDCDIFDDGLSNASCGP